MTDVTPTTPLFPTPSPVSQPETRHYWAAASEGRLELPRCGACNQVIWYPRSFCPLCGSQDVVWFTASGRGTIYSYTVNRRGQADAPEFHGTDTFVVAYVELEEGPRVVTNIVDCDPNTVRIGQSVEVVFHAAGEGRALVRFRPI